MFDHVLNRTEQVVHTDRTLCRNDGPRGFHDFTFLCVIRSPSRFSTARTNITDTFPSIVVTNVEEFSPPQEAFKAQRLRTFHLISGRETIQYAQYWRTGCQIKGAG